MSQLEGDYGPIGGGSPPSGSVSLGDLEALAAFSVIGNETATAATPTAVKMTSVPGYATTATAAGTTTLTNLSKGVQAFTGVTTQICKLPVVTTLIQTGFFYEVINNSTGSVTVNSSGSNAVQVMIGGSRAVFIANKVTADTTAAAWDVLYWPSNSATGTGAYVLAAGATLTTTTVNKWTLTAPTTASTLTSGVDNGVYTLPGETSSIGYLNIPQNSKSAAYELVALDAGKHIYHPVGDANSRQFTIPANSGGGSPVAFAIGTAVTFVNDSANDITVVITTDVLAYADVGTITTLTIPQYNQATILKVTTTRWVASGTAGCTTA